MSYIPGICISQKCSVAKGSFNPSLNLSLQSNIKRLFEKTFHQLCNPFLMITNPPHPTKRNPPPKHQVSHFSNNFSLSKKGSCHFKNNRCPAPENQNKNTKSEFAVWARLQGKQKQALVKKMSPAQRSPYFS